MDQEVQGSILRHENPSGPEHVHQEALLEALSQLLFREVSPAPFMRGCW